METKFRLIILHFLVIIISTLFIIISHTAATKDTLRQGDKLDFSTYLVSAKNTFTLGFFNFGKWWYLGIWYTTDPDETKVWVANRNTPLLHNSGTLTLDSAGNLKITSSGGDLIELYTHAHDHHISSTNTSLSASATLKDDGNFVLRELNEDGTEKSSVYVLWQSFDYPTDTLLPGMKLGINHKITGRKWYLTSWLTDTDPSTGAFTLEWDPGRGSLVVKRRGELYWTSGVLRERKFDFLNSRQKDAFTYDFTSVTTSDEDYFMYAVKEGNNSKWVLDFQGIIYDREEVELVYVDSCYGFNSDRGCVKWAVPECRSNNHSIIFNGPSTPPKDNNYQVYVSETGNASLSDCRYNCWQNCDCVGFNTIDSHATGCVYWSLKQMMNYSVYSGPLEFGQFLTLSNDPEPSTGNGSNQNLEFESHKQEGLGRKKWVWIAISTSVTILIILGIIGYFGAKVYKQKGNYEENTYEYILELVASDPHRTAYSNELQNEGNGHNLKVYSFEAIKAATNNFLSNNKLGEGGFGPVYKGKLPDGREIAVKRLSKGSDQGIVEFRNELILIAELQHTNLVRLIGCCIHEEEKMLIYEYMLNKSLDYFLFDETKRKILDWPKRLNIIQGIAQGLLYLHKHSRLKVIHRDLKASNILLDHKMDPKISDFGMARIFIQNKPEENTMRVVGTYGYMSPEYAMEGTFSEKSDVFSFGVIMLEIVSGRKNNSFYIEDCPLNLVGYAWELWNNGAALDLMDCEIKDSSCPQQQQQQLLRCIHVGLLCVQESATERPFISEVISMLSNENMPQTMPKKPAYFNASGRSKKSQLVSQNLYQGSTSGTHSVNGLSVSILRGR